MTKRDHCKEHISGLHHRSMMGTQARCDHCDPTHELYLDPNRGSRSADPREAYMSNIDFMSACVNCGNDYDGDSDSGTCDDCSSDSGM